MTYFICGSPNCNSWFKSSGSRILSEFERLGLIIKEKMAFGKTFLQSDILFHYFVYPKCDLILEFWTLVALLRTLVGIYFYTICEKGCLVN